METPTPDVQDVENQAPNQPADNDNDPGWRDNVLAVAANAERRFRENKQFVIYVACVVLMSALAFALGRYTRSSKNLEVVNVKWNVHYEAFYLSWKQPDNHDEYTVTRYKFNGREFEEDKIFKAGPNGRPHNDRNGMFAWLAVGDLFKFNNGQFLCGMTDSKADGLTTNTIYKYRVRGGTTDYSMSREGTAIF
eukprot:84427_1